MDEVKTASTVTTVVNTAETAVKAVDTIASASTFSVISKIVLIIMSIFSGLWFAALKRKFARADARKTEDSVNKQAEQEQRTDNQVENQQASSDSKKIDDILK